MAKKESSEKKEKKEKFDFSYFKSKINHYTTRQSVVDFAHAYFGDDLKSAECDVENSTVTVTLSSGDSCKVKGI